MTHLVIDADNLTPEQTLHVLVAQFERRMAEFIHLYREHPEVVKQAYPFLCDIRDAFGGMTSELCTIEDFKRNRI